MRKLDPKGGLPNDPIMRQLKYPFPIAGLEQVDDADDWASYAAAAA